MQFWLLFVIRILDLELELRNIHKFCCKLWIWIPWIGTSFYAFFSHILRIWFLSSLPNMIYLFIWIWYRVFHLFISPDILYKKFCFCSLYVFETVWRKPSGFNEGKSWVHQTRRWNSKGEKDKKRYLILVLGTWRRKSCDYKSKTTLDIIILI